MLYLATLSVILKGKEKLTKSVKKKFISTKPPLQRLLKGIPQTEGNGPHIQEATGRKQVMAQSLVCKLGLGKLTPQKQ